jgi:hypothetical protein
MPVRAVFTSIVRAARDPRTQSRGAPSSGEQRTKPVDLVDVLVLAAMLEMGCTAPDARGWLHAVMKRPRDIGRTVEEAEEGLRPMTAVAAGAVSWRGRPLLRAVGAWR